MTVFQKTPDEMLDHMVRRLSSDPDYGFAVPDAVVDQMSADEKLAWIRKLKLPPREEPSHGLVPCDTIGRPDYTDIGFLRHLAQKGYSVGRLWVKNRDPESEGQAGYFGTGFLVGPDLLMTNNHVIRDDEDARHTVVWLNYIPREEERYEYAVRELVTGSPEDELDYSIVRLDGCPADACPKCQPLALKHAGSRPEVNEPVFIIQHPKGKPQQVVFKNNDVCRVYADDKHLLHYEADTDKGSSGAPVFDTSLQIVALHHAFDEFEKKNEGIFMPYILKHAGL